MTIPCSHEDPPQTLPSWKLPYTDIRDPHIADDLEADLSTALAFREKYEGRVANLSASELLEAVKHREALTERARAPQLYAVLMVHNYQNMKGVSEFYKDVIDKSTAIGEELQFWDKELQQLDGDKLNAMLEENKELVKYRPYFSQLRRFTDHTPSLETLTELNRHGSALSEATLDFSSQEAPGAARQQQLLRDFMRDNQAKMRLRIDDKVLPLSGVLTMRQSKDPGERRQAYEALCEASAAYAEGRILTQRIEKDGTSSYIETTTPTPAALMNKLIKAKNAEDSERNYERPDSAAMLKNNLEPDIVEALRTTVKAHYSLPQRYYKTKATLLGQEQLQPWDSMAPVTSSQQNIPWEEAKAMVLNAFESFSPEIRQIAERAFNEGWIDAQPREGKYHGAYCCDPSDGLRVADHPYISLNYHGKPKDVLSLAHELGHAVHFHLASQKQKSDLLSDFSLAFAETASLFAETIVFKQLMEKARTDEEKLDLLDQKINKMIGTVMTQMSYDDFEQQVHEQIKAGETLTTEQYSEIWKECHEKRLGDAMATSPKDKHNDWAMVSHLYNSPFYVHSYAFADLLVSSLYQQYEQGDKTEFMQKYTQLLEAGGTEHHDVALKQRFGDAFDLTNPQFWEGGLKVLGGMVEEYEALAQKIRDKATPQSTVIPMGRTMDRTMGGTTEPNPATRAASM